MFSSPPVFAAASHVLRPETADRKLLKLERFVTAVTGPLFRRLRSRESHWRGMILRINMAGDALRELTAEVLHQKVLEVRSALHSEGFTDKLVIESFALIRENADRSLGMRHFDVQLLGGLALLYGTVAEMNTGEGKSLTATLAAATAALAGVPVHIITVNDYLTARDADEFKPLYEMLGLRVGCVVHDVPQAERREAYACDVTYCTNKELTFDYLRDRLVLGEATESLRLQAEYLYGQGSRVSRLLLRGLHFAIVDEADSVLVDEARTPLVISSNTDNKEEELVLREALVLARSLDEGNDYNVNRSERQVKLTVAGKARVATEAKNLGPLWTGMVRREGLIGQALSALHLFKKDVDYLVQDGKVQIIDENTGRVMADRSWERGLHQLVEIKEDCEVTLLRETLARISFQRFFRRYLHIAGMTGTAREMADELWSVYRLPITRIPDNKALRRHYVKTKHLRSIDQKWQCVVDRVRELHANGVSVLVGTPSVRASEVLSALFHKAGLPHRVLNARQDQEEADVIASAGQVGQVTIATSMAGRGTDIKLAPEVAEKGGLHVILTQRFDAARNDRQLAGRCARQGNPGVYEEILALEDTLLQRERLGVVGRILGSASCRFLGLDLFFSGFLARNLQRRIERMHARARKAMWRHDERRDELLAFSGRGE